MKRTKKSSRIISFILAACMIFGMLPALGIASVADSSFYHYLKPANAGDNPSSNLEKWEIGSVLRADCVDITSALNEFEYISVDDSGWYVVIGNDTMLRHIEINADVNLLLLDGSKMIVDTGEDYSELDAITIKDGGSLNIYSQSKMTGELVLINSNETCAINDTTHSGISFNGGIIRAESEDSNGIWSYGNILVNGGNIISNGGMVGEMTFLDGGSVTTKNSFTSGHVFFNGGNLNAVSSDKAVSFGLIDINCPYYINDESASSRIFDATTVAEVESVTDSSNVSFTAPVAYEGGLGYFYTFDEAVSNSKDNEVTVTLLKDVFINNTITVGEGEELSLNLNGHMIASSGKLIVNEGSLIFEDFSEGNRHFFGNAFTDYGVLASLNAQQGDNIVPFITNNGYFEANYVSFCGYDISATNSSLVLNNDEAVFSFCDFAGNEVTGNGSSLIINSQDATAEFTNCKINENTCVGEDSCIVLNHGDAKFSDTDIKENNVAVNNIYSDGILKLENSFIEGNQSVSAHPAVEANNSDVIFGGITRVENNYTGSGENKREENVLLSGTAVLVPGTGTEGNGVETPGGWAAVGVTTVNNTKSVFGSEFDPEIVRYLFSDKNGTCIIPNETGAYVSNCGITVIHDVTANINPVGIEFYCDYIGDKQAEKLGTDYITKTVLANSDSTFIYGIDDEGNYMFVTRYGEDGITTFGSSDNFADIAEFGNYYAFGMVATDSYMNLSTGKSYATANEGLNEISNGQTLKLYRDTEENNINFKNDTILDLFNHVITVVGKNAIANTEGCVTTNSASGLFVLGNVTVKNGTIAIDGNSTAENAVYTEVPNFTLDNVTIDASNTEVPISLCAFKGNVNIINGSAIKSGDGGDAIDAFGNGVNNSLVTINTENDISGNLYADYGKIHISNVGTVNGSISVGENYTDGDVVIDSGLFTVEPDDDYISSASAKGLMDDGKYKVGTPRTVSLYIDSEGDSIGSITVVDGISVSNIDSALYPEITPAMHPDATDDTKTHTHSFSKWDYGTVTAVTEDVSAVAVWDVRKYPVTAKAYDVEGTYLDQFASVEAYTIGSDEYITPPTVEGYYCTMATEDGDQITNSVLFKDNDWYESKEISFIYTPIEFDWSEDGSSCNMILFKGSENESHPEISYEMSVNEDVTLDPTCHSVGSKTSTATLTQNDIEITTSEDFEVGMTEHNIVPHDGQDATCTEDGWEEYETCSNDGCEYTTYQVIDALGHSFGNVTIDKALDGKSATAVHYCENDPCEESETIVFALPQSLLVDGNAKELVVTGSMTDITPEITYFDGDEQPIDAPSAVGSYTVEIEVDGAIETLSFEIRYPDFTLTISGSSSVTNGGTATYTLNTDNDIPEGFSVVWSAENATIDSFDNTSCNVSFANAGKAKITATLYDNGGNVYKNSDEGEVTASKEVTVSEDTTSTIAAVIKTVVNAVVNFFKRLFGR